MTTRSGNLDVNADVEMNSAGWGGRNETLTGLDAKE